MRWKPKCHKQYGEQLLPHLKGNRHSLNTITTLKVLSPHLPCMVKNGIVSPLGTDAVTTFKTLLLHFKVLLPDFRFCCCTLQIRILPWMCCLKVPLHKPPVLEILETEPSLDSGKRLPHVLSRPSLS